MGDNNTTNNNNSTTPLLRLHSVAAAATDLKPAKRHRPNVDTEASKGRKMRYTVHEKLRDFMVGMIGRLGEKSRLRSFFGDYWVLGVRTADGDV